MDTIIKTNEDGTVGVDLSVISELLMLAVSEKREIVIASDPITINQLDLCHGHKLEALGRIAYDQIVNKIEFFRGNTRFVFDSKEYATLLYTKTVDIVSRWHGTLEVRCRLFDDTQSRNLFFVMDVESKD
jgi:hypothetical protein